MRKASIVFLVTCLLWLAFLKAYTIVAAPVPANTINCNKSRPNIRVQSSEGKRYAIDVCSIADSASGEDFRTEIQ